MAERPASMFRVIYEDEHAFYPVCPVCGRPVAPDKTIKVEFDGELADQPNATCSFCGRVRMPEG